MENEMYIISTYGFRLFMAIVLGMLLGAERILAHKTAGVRTYALVTLGAAVFCVISDILFYEYLGSDGFNPAHIPSSVVAGVGFIGTGLLAFRDKTLTGLTTASGLWVAAGIGMAAGFGYILLASLITFLTLFVFIVLWLLEEKLKHTNFYEKLEHTEIDIDLEKNSTSKIKTEITNEDMLAKSDHTAKID
jgi:putative Mg2+ transporter-C (MgtC) family protein